MGVSVREKRAGSGDFYVYVRHAGERVAFKYDSEDEAQAVAHAFRQEIALGRLDLTSLKKRREVAQAEHAAAVTLRDYFTDTLRPQWETTRNTASSYATSFRVHILPVLGDLPLTEISRPRVKAFVVSLLGKQVMKKVRKKTESGDEKVVEVPVRPLSKDTIRNVVAPLRSAFSEAVESEDVPVEVNPAMRLGKFYREAGAYRGEVDPFQEEEVPPLLEATLAHYGFNSYCLLLTAIHGGLRAGELAALRWADLDFRTKVIHVQRQITRGEKRRPKMRKARKVDMSSTLHGELQELRKRRQEAYLGKGLNEIPELVFVNRRGQRVDMDNYRNRVFIKACDKAKVRRRRLHDTRHTFASLLINNGETLKYIQTQLGHSSIRLTADTYAHLIPGKNRQAVDRLPSMNSAARTRATSA